MSIHDGHRQRLKNRFRQEGLDKFDEIQVLELLLFYAVDPVFAIAAGMFAGKQPRQLWFLPVIIPLLFLLGSWVCFDFGQPDFIPYAMMYLLLGGTTMFIFLIMTNGRKR